MHECMMIISIGVGCRCGEQLVEDAFTKNPSGGRECGEKRRREETVGNCGDNTKSMRKQSRRSKEHEGRN